MASHAGINTTGALTPSELVFLNGEKFAKKVMVGNIDLMHVDAKVSAEELGGAMLATAFLACADAGGVRLEARQKKATLGLRKVETLYADPTGAATRWPVPSLEAEISILAAQLQMREGNNEVSKILYDWIGDDSVNPWQKVFDRVKAGMAARGMLEAIEEKKLKVVTLTRYKLPQETASTAASLPIDPIQRMLFSFKQERDKDWTLLMKGIRRAVRSRTEQMG